MPTPARRAISSSEASVPRSVNAVRASAAPSVTPAVPLAIMALPWTAPRALWRRPDAVRPCRPVMPCRAGVRRPRLPRSGAPPGMTLPPASHWWGTRPRAVGLRPALLDMA